MKKAISALLLTGAIWAAAAYPASASEGVLAGRVATVSSSLNVRAEASIESERIASLAHGAYIAVFGEKNGWYRVGFGDGEFGWCSAEYIAPMEGYRARVDRCWMLNVRATPQGKIIDTLLAGETVTVLPSEQRGGWARVIYRSQCIGYVGASYLTELPPEEDESGIQKNTALPEADTFAAPAPEVTVPTVTAPAAPVPEVTAPTAPEPTTPAHEVTAPEMQSKPTVIPETAPQRYAARTLAVPAYRQYDERWESMTLGGSGETVRAVGCTVTCLAMSEAYLRDASVTPAVIVETCDFDENGCVCWPQGYERIWDGDCLAMVYERLEQGIPTIIHARNNAGISHWVIVTGFRGGDTLTASGFTIHDPATVRRTTLADFFAVYPHYVKIAWYAGN